MSGQRKENEVDVCIDGKLTKNGKAIDGDTWIDAIESDQLLMWGACSDKTDHLSVTGILNSEHTKAFKKADFRAFLERYGYVFEGEIWEEPNEDWKIPDIDVEAS